MVSTYRLMSGGEALADLDFGRFSGVVNFLRLGGMQGLRQQLIRVKAFKSSATICLLTQEKVSSLWAKL